MPRIKTGTKVKVFSLLFLALVAIYILLTLPPQA